MLAKWLRSGLGSGRITERFTVAEAEAVQIRDSASDWMEMDEGDAVRMRRIFGRSVHVRHIDVGSCNACESEVLALSNPQYNFHRLGIFFTSSPRHADVLLVTGMLTPAMKDALRATYEAMPKPRIVIAAGVCTLSGGVFQDSRQFAGAVETVVPVDAYIPGCPPSPRALLRGILRTVSGQEGGAQL